MMQVEPQRTDQSRQSSTTSFFGFSFFGLASKQSNVKQTPQEKWDKLEQRRLALEASIFKFQSTQKLPIQSAMQPLPSKKPTYKSTLRGT